MNWMRCKRGHCDVLKIPFILAPRSSREESDLIMEGEWCHFPILLITTLLPRLWTCSRLWMSLIKPAALNWGQAPDRAWSGWCLQGVSLPEHSIPFNRTPNCWHNFNGYITLFAPHDVYAPDYFHIDYCKHKYPPARFTHILYHKI